MPSCLPLRPRARAMLLIGGKLAALCFVLMPCQDACAGLITLNFESLGQNDAAQHFIGPTYSSQGFTLTALASDPLQGAPDFSFFGDLSPFFPGATALFHHLGGQEITLTRLGGGTFDLESIDLAQLNGGDTHGQPIPDPPFPLTFTGKRADNSTVTATATVDGFLTLKTFDFTGFDDLVEVDWFQGAGAPDVPTHQFDNVVLETASVPEPSTFILITIGAVACAMRRLNIVARLAF